MNTCHGQFSRWAGRLARPVSEALSPLAPLAYNGGFEVAGMDLKLVAQNRE